MVHIGFAILFLLAVLFFYWLDNRSIIDLILKLGGYTYGPLLGIFVFGMFTKRSLNEIVVPTICLLSPILTWQLADHAPQWLGGYKFGYELIVVNGLITYFGLFIFSNSNQKLTN
jgi:Na+/proline symporter